MKKGKLFLRLSPSRRSLMLGVLCTLLVGWLLAAKIGPASRALLASSNYPKTALAAQATATVLAFGLPLVEPVGIISSPDESTLYISDYGAQAIFRLPASGGTPVMIAAGDPFTNIRGMTISPDGSTLYIAGWLRGQILSLPVTGGTPTLLALGVERLPQPSGIALSPNGSTLYIADQSGSIFSLPAVGGTITILHSGAPLSFGPGGPTDISISPDGSTLFVASGPGGVSRLPATGGTPVRLDTGPPITNAYSLTVSADGTTLFIRNLSNNNLAEVYSLPVTGGTATLVYSGFPLLVDGFINTSRDGRVLYTADRGHPGSSVADRAILINLACTPVSITTQPSSQTTCTGARATFSVTAGGSGPFSYQWRKNGTAIAGATGSSFSIAAVAASDTGNYDVMVSGPCGATAISATATLTVNSLTLSAPPPITVGTGPGATACGVVLSDAALGMATTSYNCESVTISRSSVPTGNLFPVGTTTITYTANTPSGRTATATQVVTVSDSTPPAATCPASTSAVADACGRATVPNLSSGVTASDNCGPLTITQSPMVGALVGLGTTTIMLSVTDPSNNSTTCTTTFTVTGPSGPVLTALGPAKIWVGLKNSDAVGTKFDLLAEALKNGAVIGAGQLNDVPGGSSGFNNALLETISLSLPGPVNFGPGDTLSIRLSVRTAASSSHVSGTARLWYDAADANSRFNATISGVTSDYFLRENLALDTTAGSGAKKTIDVHVNRNAGGNPFKPFGVWSKTF